MKKTLNKTAAYLLTAIIAATSGVCAVTQSANAAESDKAVIHITSQEIDDYTEYYYGFKTGTLTQDDVITANVGDVLEVVVYAQAKDLQHPLFCNSQVSVFFSTDSCCSDDMCGKGNGVLEFCGDYYDPERHIVSKPEIGGVMSPNVLDFDDPDWVKWYKRRDNAVYYNFSDISLVDFSEPTVMLRFTVRVAKAGECYINTGCIEARNTEIIKNRFHDYSVRGANLHTDVKVVKSAHAQQIIEGDVDGDGKLTILDATLIQQYLAKFINFSDEQLMAADMDGSGKIGIEDVTVIQVHLAGFNRK